MITDQSLSKGEQQDRGQAEQKNTGGNGTWHPCLHHYFEDQAACTPHLPAIRYKDEQLSYDEFDKLTNQCARYLRSIGVGPNRIIGVLMDRSVEMLIAVMGILKAGGAYLPLDPAYPKERLLFMLEDSDTTIVLSQEKWQEAWSDYEGTFCCLDSHWEMVIAPESADRLNAIAAQDDLAYVIYTSGSTGNPKGCMLPHRAICNRLLWMQKQYVLDERDRVLQKTPFTFDVSVWELFWPLLAGACLVIAKPGGHKDSHYLVDIIEQEGITVCHFVPSMLRFFINNPNAGRCTTLRHIYTSGEALPYDLMIEVMGKLPARLHNLYGPTEAAVDVTYWECEDRPDKRVPIGFPITGIQLYVLDEHLQQVPQGAEGELHIGGCGLANGYLNRPELSEEKFIANPFSREQGSKLYKTGDWVRELPDGALDYLGRTDFQVKLRGNRIELGEIEAVIKEYGPVRDCVLVVQKNVADDPKLVAYIVADGSPPESKQLRDFVRNKLPEFMVPNFVVTLPAFPVTHHGKLDRTALPWPLKEETTIQESGAEQVAAASAAYSPIHDAKPATPVQSSGWAEKAGELQSALLSCLNDSLGLIVSGEHDDLFDAGATSLTLVQVVDKVQQSYNVQIPVDLLLESPYVKAIVDYIVEHAAPVPAPAQTQSRAPSSEALITQSEYIQLADDFEWKQKYSQGSSCRAFQPSVISFEQFGRYMSLLGSEAVKGETKYLYPTAGGLNSIQTYVYIKEHMVEGIQAGIYYYDPIEHTLMLITAGPGLDRTLFNTNDRGVYDDAGFVVFFIAELRAIVPVYKRISSSLVTLDAGYMGQLMVDGLEEVRLGALPTAGVDFERIQHLFQLGESHKFIHSLLCGIPSDELGQDGNSYMRRSTGKGVNDHIHNYTGEHTFEAFLSVDLKSALQNISPQTKGNSDEHPVHLRQFPLGTKTIALDRQSFSPGKYIKRSSQRDYMDKPLSLQQLGRVLSLFAQTDREHQNDNRIIPSLSGAYGVQAYLYIKQNGVEGLDEGIYQYDPGKHGLIMISSQLSKSIKGSYTPFNRKQYGKAAFCLYFIGKLEQLEPIYAGDSLYAAFLEAGYLGQRLMDHQAVFDIGVCPIGGMNFDRIRADFRLDNDQVLLHSFTCGVFVHEPFAETVDPPVIIQAARSNLIRKREAVQHDLAIVGISGKFPGAEDLETFWSNLKAGKSSFQEFPDSRERWWNTGKDTSQLSKKATGLAGYLNDIDCFDSLLFHISPSEARRMDPQERLCLEAAWACLENAGYTAANLNQSCGKIGVFTGAMWSDYQNQNAGGAQGSRDVQATSLHSSIANRISYFFNFTGPSLSVNTSCSSALTAIHLAGESLKRGECNAAIVIGVNLMTHAYHSDVLEGLEFLSKDGVCRPFGAEANGWVAGEGVGAILLKPIEEAEQDRDYIHGLIKGTAIGHTGKSARFGAPKSAAQAQSIEQALADARVAPESIHYIEAAAPGAGLADAAEIDAIKKVFQHKFEDRAPCYIGSVKANIGHLESASAMSQIAKVLLQMKHKAIVPTLNTQPRNPFIQLQGSGLKIAESYMSLPSSNFSGRANTAPFRVLINAFGATGSGGHIIMEQYTPLFEDRVRTAKPIVIPLSAASCEQLDESVSRLYTFLTHNKQLNLADVGYTLQTGRNPLNERIAFVASSMDEFIQMLDKVLQGAKALSGVYRGNKENETERKPLDYKQADEGNPYSIAEHWVRGEEMKWEVAHQGNERRVPLPTYPFARNSHWMSVDSEAAVPTLQQPSVTAGSAARLMQLEDYLKQCFSEVSEIAVSQISAKATLDQYGISSLMIAALNAKLERDFGELPKTLFFEYQTLHELACYLSEKYAAQVEVLFPGASAAVVLPQATVSKPFGHQAEAERKEKKAAPQSHSPADIAIIGVSGRYPQAQNIAEFWENLKHGVDCITEIPVTRWEHSNYYDEQKSVPGKAYSKWGGFIEDVDKFDPLFFSISPRESERLDPQERLFLETVWHTIEDAGYNRNELKNKFNDQVGVFVGVMYGEYQLLNKSEAGSSLISSYASIANRTSYFLNFHGPSIAIDTMCSSSLTALHLAVESIKRGECRAAVVGGVNLSLHPSKYIAHSQLAMSSTDGRCHSFGEGGDGFVPGEGVGALLVKPLDQAIQDGDHIYGVIKATSVNHGGKTNGYTVPNPAAQSGLISEALGKAQIDARTISYVEAHGTGTSLGDPIEVSALTRSFEEYTEDCQYCAIGSVKSNIGHLEAAAGIAGITKVLLQMQHKQLVPTLHAQSLNPNICFEKTPFTVQQQLRPWNQPVVEMNGGTPVTYPRRASVSSFGAGGANAHVIIEEYENPLTDNKEHGTEPVSYAFVLSAKNEERLLAYARQLSGVWEDQTYPVPALADLAYTLQVGREPLEERLAFEFRSFGELKNKLQSFIDGRGSAAGVFRGQSKENRDTLTAFTDDEELQEAMNKWLIRRKYSKILEFWAKGLDMDWTKLYINEKPMRIALPVYPFAKERYWIKVSDTHAMALPREESVLHPLLHRNTSDLSEQRFSSVFSGREFFLRDHVIDGKLMLPGVAHLEMARAAALLATSQPVDACTGVCVKNVVWSRPVIQGNGPAEVHIGLYPEDSGDISYEIYGMGKGYDYEENATMYSQGTVSFVEHPYPPNLDIPALHAQCQDNTYTGDSIYETFSAMRMSYGPAFKGIEQLYAGTDQVLAKLAMPAGAEHANGDLILHPSIVDAALQASVGLMLNSVHEEAVPALKPAVPFALQEIEIIHPSINAVWAWVRYAPGSAPADQVRKLDIDLCDEHGRILIRVRGLSTRVMDSTGDAGNSSQPGMLMLEPVWSIQDEPLAVAPLDFAQQVVFLCELEQPSLPLLEAYLKEDMPTVSCEALSSLESNICERYMAYAGRIIARLQDILKAKPKGKILVQIVSLRQQEGELFSGLSSILKTAQLEHPGLIGQHIELDTFDGEKQLAAIMNRNGQRPEDTCIRYQNGERLVGGWKEAVELPESGDNGAAHLPWKDNGVYLITGGAGGLGLVFAREIATCAKRVKLILAGRSKLREHARTIINEVEALGATVVYKQADLTKLTEVSHLISEIVHEYGELNGILHAAGVIRDQFIINKSAAECRQVLAPKVAGLINLDEASKALELDFLMLFSSLTSAMGNPGQADYACANAFMDEFAAYRNSLAAAAKRTGQALSINWPLWKNGGMHLDEASEKAMYQHTGMVSMDAELGFNVLYRAFAAKRTQFLVAAGHVERIRRKLLPQTSEAAISSGTATKSLSAASPVKAASVTADSTNQLAQVQNMLIQQVSNLLKVNLQDIDVFTELGEYGFDSITLTEFANALNQIYGTDLTPALFYEHSTIQRIAAYLIETYAGMFMASAKPEVAETIVDGPSGQEAAALQTSLPPGRKHRRFAGCTGKQDTPVSGMQTESPALPPSPEPIAIVGASGTFPMAGDLEEFWNNLLQGKDCITEVPLTRWDWREYYGDPAQEANKTNIKWGGFIDGGDEFDPLFFGISPREAEFMDPQQRLLMTYAWKALEDAGYSAQSISGTKTAIFVGTTASGYSELISAANIASEGYTSTGMAPSMGPNRMSYFLNVHGPSEPIETACSSSLVAIHRAVSAIESGSCEMALVGGVNTIVVPSSHIMFNKAGMLCEDGRCKTFSSEANGYVRGEGVGMLFLKKLKDAEEAGDHIYGLIRSSAENHGGRATSLTAPNPRAQADLLVSSYMKAGIDPRTVGYIEAHGTGTELGDPIEINGLKAAFKELYEKTGDSQVLDAHCGLGSVKTNIGHLELAAGIAGVMKCLLQMKHKTLVKSLHSEKLNPYIQLQDSPFYIVQEAREWKAVQDEHGNDLPRRAGVSSFGFGGANAHIVLEEYIPANRKMNNPTISDQNPALIVLSGKNESALLEQAALLLCSIKENQYTDADLADIAYTLQVGREAMEERLGIIAGSVQQLSDKLQSFLEGKQTTGGVYRGQLKRNKEAMAIFASDEDMAGVVDVWIAKRKYAKLLELWVKGLHLDWSKLYAGSKPSRVSLPTYPFAKERYWVKANQETAKPPKIMDATEPVVKYMEVSREEEETEAGLVVRLTQIIAELVRIPASQLQKDEELAAYGLDSIGFMGLINTVRELYQVKLSPKQLLEYTTISKLAHYILHELQEHAPASVASRQSEEFSLSSGQKGLWLINQLAPESYAYNIPNTYRIRQYLHLDALRAALRSIVLRHSMLRATIRIQDQEPVHTIGPADRISVQTEEVGHLSQSQLMQHVSELARLPFDLEQGPLLRVHVLTLSDQDYILLMNVHHLVFDGTSVMVLLRELLQLYAGEMAGEDQSGRLPAVKPYSDFVEWQAKLLQSKEGQESRAYWQQKLSGELPVLNLPMAKPRREVSSFKGATYDIELSPELSAKIQSVSLDEKVSPFVLMLSALKVLLYRYTNQEDIMIGTAVERRPGTGFQHTIGYFMNMVLIRSEVSGDSTFRHVMQEVRANTYDALEHADYPFSEIVKDIKGSWQRGDTPLIQVAFIFQNWFQSTDQLINGNANVSEEQWLSLEHIKDIHQEGEFDLTLEIIKIGDRYRVCFKYNPELFSGETVMRMSGHYTELLRSFTGNREQAVGRVDYLTSEDKTSIAAWNTTEAAYPHDRCIHQLFEEQVERTPYQTAIIFEGRKLTYAELNEKANRLARVLRHRGLKPNMVVGIIMERSLEMMVCLFGILKAGGAYLPIDREYPKDRMDYLLQNSNAQFLILQHQDIAKVEFGGQIISMDQPDSFHEDGSNLSCINKPDDLVYVIYTSGSTGRPKGVMIEHHSLINRLKWTRSVYALSENDVLLQKTPYTFDCSVWELFCWSTEGAQLCILPPNAEKDPEAIMEAVERNQVTLIHFVPSMLNLFLEYFKESPALTRLSTLKRVFTTGEALTVPQVGLFNKTLHRANGTRLMNLYGPTEATIEVTYYDCPTEGTVERIPIGKPMSNIKLYVVNAYGQMQPVGVPGELCIAGAGLARGYINNPQLTDDKFVANPFEQGTKMYKTGDLAKWLPDGNIEYFGRTDRQVKIRGFRMELGEIEAGILEHVLISEACVVVDPGVDRSGNSRLKAYYVTKDGKKLTGEVLKAFLRGSLPEYMIPSLFVQLDVMPLTAHGKLDFKALEAYAAEVNEPVPDKPAKDSNMQHLITTVYQEMLGLVEIDPHANFFDLGGHSMLLVKAAIQLRELLGREVTPAELFKYPTVHSLAAHFSQPAKPSVFEGSKQKANKQREILMRLNPAKK
ncbi:non-ribosomal peptide synthetase [Paenibacillus donghaensis]|uniref:non-ribosomal peptide synthetase n=1 Tax=Paenibacillus donghaensis TaxID=414771 RepID=UPI000B435A1C|nr:non-ribosomal peptide synthetase [Paenibacillus donghaensis]